MKMQIDIDAIAGYSQEGVFELFREAFGITEEMVDHQVSIDGDSLVLNVLCQSKIKYIIRRFHVNMLLGRNGRFCASTSVNILSAYAALEKRHLLIK